MMKKPVLAIDCDDVMLPFQPSFIAYCNEQLGTAVRYEDFVDFANQPQVFGVDQARLQALADEHVSMHSLAIAPYFGVLDALVALADVYDLHMVTSRAFTHETATLSWLTHYGLAVHFMGVHFGGTFLPPCHPDAHRKRGKAEMCLEIAASLLIDDAPHHAEALRRVNIPVILFDRPWNQGYTGEQIHRVHAWDEVVEHLLR